MTKTKWHGKEFCCVKAFKKKTKTKSFYYLNFFTPIKNFKERRETRDERWG